MAKIPVVDTAIRLRAIMAQFELGNRDLAAWCEANPGTESNWLAVGGKDRKPHKNGIPVKHAIPLCEHTGLTLDWIYRGSSAVADSALVRALERRIASGDIKQPVHRTY